MEVFNRKKYYLLFFLNLLTSYFWFTPTISVQASYSGGTGSADDPFLISTVEDIYTLASEVKAGNSFLNQHLLVTTDLDFEGHDDDGNATNGNFNGIGNSNRFSGTFDGGNHTLANVKGLKKGSETGFFNQTNGATIKNIVFDNLVWQATNNRVGGLIGISIGAETIENIQGNVTVQGSYDVGGLIGFTRGNMNLNNINLNIDITGLGQIQNHSRIGGLIGTSFSGTQMLIENSSVNGTISSAYALTGGLIGFINTAQTTITNSQTQVTLTGFEYLGGFTGYTLASVTILNSHADSSIRGTDYLGGLVGYNSSTAFITATNNQINTQIQGGYYTGGLVGCAFKGDLSYNQVSVSNSSSQYLGGLVGYGKNLEIKENTIQIQNNAGAGYIGGVIAYANNNVSIKKTHVTGSLFGDQSVVGGLVGYGSTTTIEESSFQGTVSGKNSVGGLIGASNYVTIKNSYGIGTITGSSNIGGLSGLSNNLTLTHSFHQGEVMGSTNTGLIAGNLSEENQLANVYSIPTPTSSLPFIGNTPEDLTLIKVEQVEQLALSDFKGNSVKKLLKGFDFETIWTATGSYPILNGQPQTSYPNDTSIEINGDVQPTLLSITIPSASLMFTLNTSLTPSFMAPELSLINESPVALKVALLDFKQTSSILNDVQPDTHSDWNLLGKQQSKDFALALNLKSEDDWLTVEHSLIYVTDVKPVQLGTISAHSRVDLDFKARYGQSFTENLTPTYELKFLFELN